MLYITLVLGRREKLFDSDFTRVTPFLDLFDVIQVKFNFFFWNCYCSDSQVFKVNLQRCARFEDISPLSIDINRHMVIHTVYYIIKPLLIIVKFDS
jgi:hypothetical protein